MGGFVLTRLHARYGKDAIGEDLVFKAAPPIAGGREWRGDGGKLEEGAVPYNINNFQARYAVRHPWTGPIACASPARGIWGGPPDGQQIATGPGQARPALELAFAPRGKVQLARLVAQDVPEIDLRKDERTPAPPRKAPPAGVQPEPKREQKGCEAGGAADASAALLLALLLAGAGLARRRGDA
jgi:hypothetical protein